MRPRRRFARAVTLTGAAVAALAASALLAPPAHADGPVPDASCAQRAGHRSLNDNTPAVIDFVNHSSITVQTFWLDFSGKRVFYEKVASGGSYSQKTWITHPWVVADLSGNCLTFYVTAATSATVTVADAAGTAASSTATGGSDTATSESTTGDGTTTSQDVAGAAGGASSGGPGTGAGSPTGTTPTATSPSGNGPPVTLIAAAVAAAAAAALAAIAAAQGWIPGRNSPQLPPGASPLDAQVGGSPSGYDLQSTPPSTSPSGYDLQSTPPSTSPTGYDLHSTPPSTSPPGYDAGPTPPSTSPPGYDAGPTPPSTSPPGYDSGPTG